MEDFELLQKIQDPETRNYGFNLLVRKYQERVYWLIRKMVVSHDDADDLTQDVFVKVYNSIHTFRQDAQLYTWIYRIATNECLNFLKRKKRWFFFPVGDDLASELTAGPHISGDEVQRRLQKALLKLPDKQRLVFNLRYFDERPYEEISAITGTSVGALKASYHLAIKKIESYLSAD